MSFLNGRHYANRIFGRAAELGRIFARHQPSLFRQRTGFKEGIARTGAHHEDRDKFWGDNFAAHREHPKFGDDVHHANPHHHTHGSRTTDLVYRPDYYHQYNEPEFIAGIGRPGDSRIMPLPLGRETHEVGGQREMEFAASEPQTQQPPQHHPINGPQQPPSQHPVPQHTHPAQKPHPSQQEPPPKRLPAQTPTHTTHLYVTVYPNETKIGGTASWRNNNPANIMDGKFARAHGAIGRDGNGFAVFPTMQAGQNAQDVLWETETYQSLTIEQAGKRWTHNDPPDIQEAYVSALSKAADAPPDTPIGYLSPDQLEWLKAAQRRQEGFKPGVTEPVNHNP